MCKLTVYRTSNHSNKAPHVPHLLSIKRRKGHNLYMTLLLFLKGTSATRQTGNSFIWGIKSQSSLIVCVFGCMLFSRHTQMKVCQADKNEQMHVTTQFYCLSTDSAHNPPKYKCIMIMTAKCWQDVQYIGQMWQIQPGPQMTSQLPICGFFI